MADWDRIVREQGPLVYRTAWRILGHAADTEDVVQEVFLQAHQFVQTRAVRHWSGLLRRLAACRALDRLRQRRSTLSLDGLDLPTNGETPDEAAVSRELAERLRQSIAELPPREAEVFCMRYFDDLSYQEIAESLSISSGAVAMALHKARAKLETLLLEPGSRSREPSGTMVPVTLRAVRSRSARGTYGRSTVNTPEQPNDSPLNELSPPLRAAVVAAKTQPVPEESQQNALRRAAAPPPRSSPWSRMRPKLLAFSSSAAMLLLGVGSLLMLFVAFCLTPPPSPQVAWDQKRLDNDLDENTPLVALLNRMATESELSTVYGRDLLDDVRDKERLKEPVRGPDGKPIGIYGIWDGASLMTEKLRSRAADEPPLVYPTPATSRTTTSSGTASSGGTGSPGAYRPSGLPPTAPMMPPTRYSELPNGPYSGPADPNKPNELAKQWDKLSEKERAALLQQRSYLLDPKNKEEPDPYLRDTERKPIASANKPVEGKPSDSTPGETKPALPEVTTKTEQKDSKPSDSKSSGDEKKDKGKKGKDDGKEVAEAKKPESKPKVWRRNGAQPTMARVYVGDGNSLDMVSLHVSVVIDGPRARTVVDHVFRNPHAKQLEGTFEYPLPTGASPSYFAMFLGDTRDTMPARFNGRGDVQRLPASALASLSPKELVANIDSTDWGRCQEARVVGKDKAKETYEETVRGRIDPALLEYASGNTFRGRVFPIAPKGYNRVILAYEELLPLVEGQLLYRFPLPDLPVNDVQFTLTANTKECKYSALLPKDAKKDSGGNQVTYTKTWKDEAPRERIALFAGTPANPKIQAVCGQQGDNGPYHFYARLRPDLKKIEKAKSFASHAVFLLDTSLSEDGDRFNTNMKLLKRILESDADIKEFNVLTFNVGAAWVEPKGWLSNDKAGREKMLSKLDGVVLEGATDFDAALTHLRKPDFAVKDGTPLNVFVLSDGHITWGETDTNTIVSRYETNTPYPSRFYCYRVGMGAENAELFDALARNGGGVFNCFSEPEMNAAATAHHNLCFTVEGVRFDGGPEASDVLLAGRKVAVHPGGELVIAAKLDGPAKGKLIVEGKFQGESMTQTFPLECGSHSETAARAWAEVAVGSLLALNDPKLDPLVTAYCQQYGVASRAASFLVLENENDYKRLNLEEERGKTVNGDLGLHIEKLWQQLGAAKSGRQAFVEFLDRIEPRVKLMQGPQGEHIKRLLALLTDKDFELPPSAVHGALVRKGDVPPTYLAERDKDRRNVGVYLKEAKRRADDGDIDGAVRVLSSVIEEHPGRGDALRLVGYRLLDMKQPDQAAHLFQQVQRQRPFEPHSYRDLARSLEDSGLYGLAAIQYEIVLSGTWHARFHSDSLKQVVQEEYARMMQDAIRRKAVSKELADHFGERLEHMASPQPQSDLRVTISWNTDATDVDLWVIEPDGTKVFYSNKKSKSGGELSEDQTQGYGPERYQVAKALPGEYKIIVHYFRPNPNLLGGETHVNVMVTRFAGTPHETTERRTVILKQHNEEVEVCKVKY